MRIAAIQHDIVWEDSAATRRHLEPMVAGAVASGAGLVVLAEMFATGFSMEAERIAEAEGGPTSTWMLEQAATHGVWLYGSVAERPAAGASPATSASSPARTAPTHRYAKLHPFTFAGEHEAYDAGDGDGDGRGRRASGSASSSATTCASPTTGGRWRPTTDLYLCCANWPEARRSPLAGAPPGPGHREPGLRGRASTGSVRVAALTYAGDSRIFDPLGEMLAGAARTETVLLADIDAGRGGEGAGPLPLPARPPHRRALNPDPLNPTLLDPVAA